jgi:hypothetical protein
MSFTVIPYPLLLPNNAVKLGRLVKSIDQPLEGYHEPFPTERPAPIVSEFDYAGYNKQESRAAFGSSLTSLISAAFSNRSRIQVQIEPRCCKSYDLDNSDAWFDRAIGRAETRKWIERAAIRGSKIFMIVGICTWTDTHLVHTTVKERESLGQVTVPISFSLAAAGAVLPLANLVDPSLSGDLGSSASNGARIFAPGEQVCAIKYREIRHKWLSSRVIENLQLSKIRLWTCTEGATRDAYEDESEDEDVEDVIEVDIIDAERLGDGWTVTECVDGLVYVRA